MTKSAYQHRCECSNVAVHRDASGWVCAHCAELARRMTESVQRRTLRTEDELRVADTERHRRNRAKRRLTTTCGKLIEVTVAVRCA